MHWPSYDRKEIGWLYFPLLTLFLTVLGCLHSETTPLPPSTFQERLFVGTGQGVNTDLSLVNTETLASQVVGSFDNVRALASNGGTGMFVGTINFANTDLSCVNIETLSSQIVGSFNLVHALASDGKTGMFVGTANNTTTDLALVNTETLSSQIVGSFNHVQALASNGGTGMFVGTISALNDALSLINTETLTSQVVGSFSRVYALASDGGTGMFVGTNSNPNSDLILINTETLTSQVVGSLNNILSLASDGKTGMFAGSWYTANEDLILVNTQTLDSQVVGSFDNVYALAFDGESGMFVGTRNGSEQDLSLVNTKTLSSQVVDSFNQIYALAVASPAPPASPSLPPPSLSVIRAANLMTLWNDLTVRYNISAHVATISPLNLRTSSKTAVTACSDPVTYSGCPVPTASVWGQGFAEYGHLSNTHTYPGFGFFSGAVQGGLDYAIGENNLLGGSFCYSHIHGYQEHNGGHSSTGSNLGSLYAVGTVGSWHFLPILLGGLNDTSYLRKSDSLVRSKATLTAWQLLPHLEINYDQRFSWGTLSPFISADWAISWLQSYQEKKPSLQRVSQKTHSSSLVHAETGLHLYEQWGSFFLREKLSYICEKTFNLLDSSYTLVGLPNTFTAATSNLTLNLGSIRIDATVLFGTCKPYVFNLGYEAVFGAKYWSNQIMIELLERF